MPDYATTEEDRVDKIAVRVYGQVSDEIVAQIIYRNPHLGSQRVYDYGVEFSLPGTLESLFENTP